MAKRNSRGCRLIATVLHEKAWGEIARRGIKASDFIDDSMIVYQWVSQYIGRFDKVPDIQLVEEETGISLPEPCDLNYAFEKFTDGLLAREIEERVRDINKSFLNGDFRGAASHFTPLKFDRQPSKTFLSERKTRYSEYCDRKLKGVQGIDIPWPTLETIFLKWEESTLNVFLAPSSQGKTWLSCYIAAETMKKGNKVLFVSMENMKGSIGRRLDSLIYKVPFEDMRRSQADLRIEEAWKSRLAQNEFNGGDIIIKDRTEVQTVADISALNQAETPDLVVVDGTYLLRGKGNSNWESSANVLEQLQLSCKLSHAPWICSSQLNPPKNKSASGYDMGFEARYAKEYMLNPDTSFILLQDEDDRAFNRGAIRVSKIREAGDISGLNTEFMIHMNRTTMDFSEIEGELEYDIEY